MRAAVIASVLLGVLILGGEVVRAKSHEWPTVVADFEAEDLTEIVDPGHLRAARVAMDGKDGGHALRCAMAGGPRVSWLDFLQVPKDITTFRKIRFRIRGGSVSTHPFYVRLVGGKDTLGLEGRVEGMGAAWQTVEIALPEMHLYKGFDPKDVRQMEFIWFDPDALTFEIDDIALVMVEGKAGWRWSEEETIVAAFGEKRAKKVHHHQTKHFDVYTDSSAARKKFPKAIEKTYDFVRDTLGVPDFETRLPVYIHQNPDLYFDFCVRYTGWKRESAQNSAGHGSARYFAAYYQSPKSDVVTHELTHSIFQRTVGAYGGSWFQEGVAVYIEYLASKRSPAKEFAPMLRGRRHTPLRQFIAIDRLLDAHNERGGSQEVANLYLQAGAIFEFLMRGPLLRPAPTADVSPEEKRAELPKAIFELAKADAEGEALVKRVEQILGKPIADIEEAWIKWGSHPPKIR